MNIDIITCFPELFQGPFSCSIVRIAQVKKHATIRIHNLREYSNDKHRKIDDYQYGGGAGMVMKIEPIVNCIEHLKSQINYEEVIYLSPDGDLLNQKESNRLSLMENIILLCGHYKGIDQRVRDHFITKEISIGEYVLSGGELAAAVVVDSIVRLIPGVLSDSTSALEDSFQDGSTIAPPVYTRPYEFRNLKVPEILLSGNEKAIDEWRNLQSFNRTKERNDKFN